MTAVSPEHPERKDGGLLCWSGLSALRIEALWCLGFRLQGLCQESINGGLGFMVL